MIKGLKIKGICFLWSQCKDIIFIIKIQIWDSVYLDLLFALHSLSGLSG